MENGSFEEPLWVLDSHTDTNITSLGLHWHNCSLLQNWSQLNNEPEQQQQQQKQQQQLDDCLPQEHQSPVLLHHQPMLVAFGLPQYYGPLYKTVGSIFVSIIFVVGLLGNVMVVYVVWRTRSMRTTTNCYLVSLAVADVLLLVSAPLPTIVEYFLIIDESLLGAGGCSVMVFCQYLGVNLSSLSITAFSVERYIAICHPLRAQTLCTVSRAKRIIAGLWMFGVVYCAPWIPLTTAKTKAFDDGTVIDTCDFRMERSYYLTYFVADLIIFYAAPLLLTSILYALIARILYASTNAPLSSATTTTTSSSSPHSQTDDGCRSSSTNLNAVQKEKWKRKIGVQDANNPTPHSTGAVAKRSTTSSRIQVTKMLAVVVCVFAILWLPYRAYVVYNSFSRQRFEDLWFLLFCRLMVYANSAINPVLYNVMSVKFRRAFHRLLCCRHRLKDGATSGATTITAAAPAHSACAYKIYTQMSRTTGSSDACTFEMN